MQKTWKSLLAFYKNRKHLLISLWQTWKAGYPAKEMTVIGVTGTDGKTTTSHLIYEILKQGKLKVALISTVGAWVGKDFFDTGLHTTTPDATFLQPILKKFKEKGVTHVVLEVTSHGLDQHRVVGCNFWGGVLTNLTHEHLDYHKTLERYKAAKAKLFKGAKVAVLNKDDSSFEYFKRKTPRSAKIVAYSLNKPADVRGTKVVTKPSGLEFFASDNGVAHPLKTALSGEYNASNILAAIGIARSLNVSWKDIQEAVKNFSGIPGRMEMVKLRPYSVIVDFAHTPNALENLLKTLKNRLGKGNRLIAVFGCAGERDHLKRPIMGEISARLANFSVFTAEDPRSEPIDSILMEMAKGARKARAGELKELNKRVLKTVTKKHYFIREPDREKAIQLAINSARAGDIIAICGKGHERSMAYPDGERPWSDQEKAKEAITKRR